MPQSGQHLKAGGNLLAVFSRTVRLRASLFQIMPRYRLNRAGFQTSQTTSTKKAAQRIQYNQ